MQFRCQGSYEIVEFGHVPMKWTRRNVNNYLSQIIAAEYRQEYTLLTQKFLCLHRSQTYRNLLLWRLYFGYEAKIKFETLYLLKKKLRLGYDAIVLSYKTLNLDN